jgi:hypothetical protein
MVSPNGKAVEFSMELIRFVVRLSNDERFFTQTDDPGRAYRSHLAETSVWAFALVYY